ncbi:hypothetical protein [Desulfolutivibrio sulfoxidireducens]|uniref:hypothetical protein n=1 Tax=Desulfolutivibrio sulfoxidireducens TaxID=2773299 RepID=UPI00159E99F9|nr:hypothetical protein [Desulfolutivibrio sulfoxidireducens]QLA19741.1 hypothetical protein GD604_08325 [Desulfolutivibrio sulfoxidireducens]
MRTRNVILLVIMGGLLVALGVAYHAKYGGHSEFMKGLWGSPREGIRSGSREGGNFSRKKGDIAARYVDRPQAEVAAFVNSPGYRDAPPELRRLKLLEFFTLKVADVDYMLLSDADKKVILDQFMSKYLIE